MPEMTRLSEPIKNVLSFTTPIDTPMLRKPKERIKKRSSKNSAKLTAFYRIPKRRLATIMAKIWMSSMEGWQVNI